MRNQRLLILLLVIGIGLMWVVSTHPNAFSLSPSSQVSGTQAVPVAQTDGGVQGPPSLTPDFINRVLSQYHSPAEGTGQALYNLSRTYGIDDAYALGFFAEESQFGTTGVARWTKSLGNIRCTPGYICQYGFRSYASYVDGYEDWYRLIRDLYIRQWHLDTVQAIIPVYAPKSDGNDPAHYVASVLQNVSVWRKGEIV